jgi:hypothetical protein
MGVDDMPDNISLAPHQALAVPPKPAPVPATDVAPVDYLCRKVLAAGAETERQAIVEICKAEVAWATRGGGWFTPPHLHAAYRVLVCWGHVHPKEYRLRERILCLRAQRKAGWHDRAGKTCADIREIWAQRHKSLGAFWAAARDYQRLRAEART